MENVCDQNHSTCKHPQFISQIEHISMKLAKERLIVEISIVKLLYEVLIHNKMVLLKVTLGS